MDYNIPKQKMISKMSKVESRHESYSEQVEQSIGTRQGQNLEWSQIKTPSTVISRRSSHTSCIYQNKLYIYGGYDNNSPSIFEDFFCFDFNKSKWEQLHIKGDKPGRRHSHGAVVYNDKMYLFGGMIDYMSNTNALHCYDFTTYTWSKITTSNPPPAIDSFSCVLYNNQLIVTLGYCNNDYNPHIYCLDLDTFTWNNIFSPSTSSKGPQPRSQGTCCLYKDSLVIYGGKDNYKIFQDFWIFDLKEKLFRKMEIKVQLQGRFGHSAIIHNQKMYIFGGTQGVTHERNDLIVVDLEHSNARTCWVDFQQERKRIKQDSSNSILKKSRRDSAKKGLSWFFGVCSEEAAAKQNSPAKSPGKYRSQLKQVNYYNSLYNTGERDLLGAKKNRKNPLLKEFKGSPNDSINLTATFEILANSVLLTAGSKSGGKEEKTQMPEYWRKQPKARDNCSSGVLMMEGKTQMIVFGGGMHKICFNDILRIDIEAVNEKYLGQEP